MNKYRLSAGFALFLTLFFASCDKYLDIIPAGDVIPETVTEFRATLNNGYASAPSQMLINMRGLVYDHQADALGYNFDAFDLYKTIHTWADTDDNDGRSEQYPYYSFYKGIFYANTIILADPATVKDDDPDEDFGQVLSEAYALRAYNYFCLVNLYGPKWSKETAGTLVVPLNNLINTEQTFPRATLEAVYDQILGDLKKAEALSQVSRFKEERYRYRFSGEAILAFASRVHLYRGEWQKALEYAQKALKVSDKLTDLNSTDKDGHLPTDYRSEEALANFTPQQASDINGYLSVQDPLLALYPEGDLRPSKYYTKSSQDFVTFYKTMAKVGSSSTGVTFRRSEVYLNAAEAASRLGNDADARRYLDQLLANRMTPQAFSLKKAKTDDLRGEKLLAEILLQRRLELAGEGHDWFDFKRTTQPELTKTVRGEVFTLPAGDPRYTIKLPKEAVENNPLLQ